MSNSAFSNVVVRTTVHLLPSRLSNIKDGVQSLLNSMLMRYQPQFDGVVLAYDKLKILDTQASIFAERPHLHFDIQVRMLLFKPAVGVHIVGTVNKVEPDHIGLLIHGVFNATVPASAGLARDFEFDPKQDLWHNASVNKDIQVGTRLRIKVSKILHNMQIVSFEGSMLDDHTTGFCD